MIGYLSSLAIISIIKGRNDSIECMQKAVGSDEAWSSQQPGSQTLAATASVLVVLTFVVSPPVQLIEQHVGRNGRLLRIIVQVGVRTD